MENILPFDRDVLSGENDVRIDARCEMQFRHIRSLNFFNNNEAIEIRELLPKF